MLLPVLGNEDDGAKEELFALVLEKKDKVPGVEELIVMLELIPDVVKAGGPRPLLENANVVE